MQKETKITRWKIIPDHPPKIMRNCPKCGGQCEFESSGNFRINANSKTIDVWLIYQCINCNTTWNMEIFSRINRKTIPEDMYRKLMENNKELARQYAFDPLILSKNKAVLTFQDITYQVEGEDIDLMKLTEPIAVNLECPHPLNLRLDKILSEKLKISRELIKKFCNSGRIYSDGVVNIAKLKVKDGLSFTLNIQ